MKEIYQPSPHGSSGTNNPRLIVIHSMGEYIDTNSDGPDPHAEEFLRNFPGGLSAHALICPDGEIMRCRQDQDTAWHAKGFNQNSLGAEFLVPGLHTYGTFIEAIKQPYTTEQQWAAGVELVRLWISKYSITRENVKRHSDLSPGRKHDPGEGFAWEDFLNACYE